MTAIYNPSDKGFDPRFTAVDRCQIALLREVQDDYGKGRLILKGGMAMRAVVGSMRLTRDIDFDRDPSFSLNAVKSGLPRTLVRAATNAGIKGAVAEITKASETTVRARLVGNTHAGATLRFEVEVSGRSALDRRYVRSEQIDPPSSYGMAPFLVETYTPDMLAAMKIGAAMSDSRNAPRDIYDLHDLIGIGANPVDLLATRPAEVLSALHDGALAKLELVTFALAREELRPYIPLAQRDALTEDAWIGYTLQAAEAIVEWTAAALRLQYRAAGTPDAPTALSPVRPPS